MADSTTPHNFAGPLCLDCDIECPPHISMALKANVKAEFYEGDSQTPTNIVKCDTPCWVNVKIDFTGCELARLLCLKWCVRIVLEICGPGDDIEIYRNVVDQKVCRTPCVEIKDIPVNFPVCDKCGTMYDVCLTVTAQDDCGCPAPFGGYCHGEHIMVYPAGK